MRPDVARGFTLVEVLVALTIGALVVLMVHQAFASAVDFSRRLDLDAEEHAREVRARRTLETAFGSLEIGVRGDVGFDAGPGRVTFSTGRHASVTVETAGHWLVLRGDSSRVDSLLETQDVVFDYLMSYGAASSWVMGWHSPASAPLAVRLRIRRDSSLTDTLFYLIGPRG